MIPFPSLSAPLNTWFKGKKGKNQIRYYTLCNTLYYNGLVLEIEIQVDRDIDIDRHISYLDSFRFELVGGFSDLLVDLFFALLATR